jgi:phage shock protein C
LAALISFGTAAIAYLVLLIAVPKANTSAEKLEMQGKAVNVDNIAKTIEESARQVGRSIEEGASRLRSNSNINGLGREVGGRVASTLGLVIKLFIGFVLGSILVAMIGGWVSYLIGFIAVYRDLSLYFFTSPAMTLFAFITGIFVIGIPIVGLALTIIRLFSGYRTPGYVTTIMSIVWTLAVIAGFSIVMMHVVEFRDRAEVENRQSLNTSKGNTLYVSMGENKLRPDLEDWEVNDVEARIPLVEFNIRQSVDSNMAVTTQRMAQGRNNAEAQRLVGAMQHSVYQGSDTLFIDPLLRIAKGDKFRGQRVHVTLYVPVGQEIRLNEQAVHQLRRVDVANHDEFWENDLSDRALIMTPRGLVVRDNRPEPKNPDE